MDNLRRVTTKQLINRNRIAKGHPALGELKEGVPSLRLVEGKLIEYVKVGAKVFQNIYNEKTIREGSANYDGMDVRKRGSIGESFNSAPDMMMTKRIEADNDMEGVGYDFKHFLGSKHLMLQVYLEDPEGNVFWINSTTFVSHSGSYESGLFFYMKDNDTINVGVGNDQIYVHDNTVLGSSIVNNLITEGDLTIYAWKINPISNYTRVPGG